VVRGQGSLTLTAANVTIHTLYHNDAVYVLSVDDEIVECDSCGVLVHEGCYGSDPTLDDDALSVRSDTSTENLEPWFCDACKAGVKPVSI